MKNLLVDWFWISALRIRQDMTESKGVNLFIGFGYIALIYNLMRIAELEYLPILALCLTISGIFTWALLKHDNETIYKKLEHNTQEAPQKLTIINIIARCIIFPLFAIVILFLLPGLLYILLLLFQVLISFFQQVSINDIDWLQREYFSSFQFCLWLILIGTTIAVTARWFGTICTIIALIGLITLCCIYPKNANLPLCRHLQTSFNLNMKKVELCKTSIEYHKRLTCYLYKDFGLSNDLMERCIKSDSFRKALHNEYQVLNEQANR